jgi:hypothetical protein
MSVVTVVLCDRCKAEIESDRTALDVRSGPLVQRLASARESGRPALDLCSACAEQFVVFLAGRPVGATAAVASR